VFLKRFPIVRDQRGTTLAELVIAMAAAGVVMMGVTSMVLSSMNTTTRVSKRVEATQNSRIVLTRLIDELNSSCVLPRMAPVQQGSTGVVLRFIHGSGSAVTPTPVLSVVGLEGTKLLQQDYAWMSGTAPNWTFEEEHPVTTTELMTGVSQISPSKPLFRYYAYSGEAGRVSETPMTTPLSTAIAPTVIQVGVALKVAPRGPSTDEATPAQIEDSATLRLTAASFHSEVLSLPCQ
jgi:hypothetical protein